MKIRDNETGEVFEYGTNIHHALRISRNGGCLMFENLQNGDGSLYSGDGGYSFVLDDGKTPEESIFSPDSFLDSYVNIGGFHKDNKNNNGWIPIDEDNIPDHEVLACNKYGDELIGYLGEDECGIYCESDGVAMGYITAWMEKPEPYRPERSNNV